MPSLSLKALKELLGFSTPAPPLPTVAMSYLQSNFDPSNLTVYQFAAENFGAADALRKIVVAFVTEATTGPLLSSATIGGVAATIEAQNSSGAAVCGIISADVPTGTSGDINLTFSAEMRRCGIAVWSLIPSGGTGIVTVDAQSAQANTVAVTATDDNALVAVGVVDDSPASSSWAAPFTQRWEQLLENSTGAAAADAEVDAGSASASITWASETTPVTAAVAYKAA